MKSHFFNGRHLQLAKLAAVAVSTLILMGAIQFAAVAEGVPEAAPLLPTAQLYFIENRGQTDSAVHYYLQGKDKTLYFTPTGVTIALDQTQEDGDSSDRWVVSRDLRHLW